MNRREFLAAAGGGAMTTASAFAPMACLAGPAGQDQSSGDGTWLTYAVNVEMTWTRLPFLDRIRKVKEAGFSHYEFWPWRGKDIDAIIKLNEQLGLRTSQFSASPVKGFGHGITNPDPRGARSSRKRSARPSPWPGSSASRSCASWPARRPAATRGTSRSRR